MAKRPPLTEFDIWYERFCIEGPPMSTKELMKEAYDEGGRQIKHYPAADFYNEDGTLRVAPNLLPRPVDSTDPEREPCPCEVNNSTPSAKCSIFDSAICMSCPRRL